MHKATKKTSVTETFVNLAGIVSLLWPTKNMYTPRKKKRERERITT